MDNISSGLNSFYFNKLLLWPECLLLKTLNLVLAMKYTQTSLDKLEAIPEEAGYVLRYERGTFQSGYCILEERKVVVLNKFLQTEGRINTLIDLIPQLDINPNILTEGSKKLHADILSKLVIEENEKPA